MRDDSLGIWIIVMFGVSGLAVMMLAWLWPALEADKLMATFAGSVGIAIAVIRAFMLRKSPAGRHATKVPVKVHAEDNM